MEHSTRLVASGQPLQTWLPEKITAGGEEMDTWGMAKLFHFIQRVAHLADGLHGELQQRCEQQHQQILTLVEDRDQL